MNKTKTNKDELREILIDTFDMKMNKDGSITIQANEKTIKAILKWHAKHSRERVEKMEKEIVMFIDDYMGKETKKQK